MKEKPRVKLVGRDGNAFAIIGAVRKALQRAGYSAEDIQRCTDEMTADDYDHLLQTAMKWCEVE